MPHITKARRRDADRDTWTHPLWPYEKVRWEELTAGERASVRRRAEGSLLSAERSIADARQVLDYLDHKESADE